jgi:hypothetical protein
MTVYVVHEPVRWDRYKRKMTPVDLDPAKAFGELKILLPGHDRPPSAQEAFPVLKEAMCGFGPDDYLVVAGDMELLVWVAVLALKKTGGKLRLLKWDNRLHRYEVANSPAELLL